MQKLAICWEPISETGDLQAAIAKFFYPQVCPVPLRHRHWAWWPRDCTQFTNSALQFELYAHDSKPRQVSQFRLYDMKQPLAVLATRWMSIWSKTYSAIRGMG